MRERNRFEQHEIPTAHDLVRERDIGRETRAARHVSASEVKSIATPMKGSTNCFICINGFWRIIKVVK